MAAAIVPIVMAGLQVAPTVVEFISGLIKRAEVNKPQPGQGQSRKAEVAAAAQRWAVPGELPAGATPQQIASLVQAVFDRVNQAGEVNRPPAQVVQGAVPGSAPNGHDMAAVAADVASVPVPAPVQGPNFYMPTDQDPALSPAGQLIELAIDRYIREAGPGDLAGMLLSWCRLRITDHRNRLAVTETRLAEALSSPQSR